MRCSRRSGRRPRNPLALELKLALRKWRNLGLDLELLQQLLCACFTKFHNTGHHAPTPRQLKRYLWPGPKPPRRRRRTYEQALAKGRITKARSLSTEEQARRQSDGARHGKEIAAQLKPLLESRGIFGRDFVAYFAFAQKLGRASRNHSGKTLSQLTADLIDLYEAKSLDRTTLFAISKELFGTAPS